MKLGLSLQDLGAKLLADAKAHRDFCFDTRRIGVEPVDGGVAFHLESCDANIAVATTPTQLAARQVATFTDIPAKYWDRMAVAAPDLLAENVRHWFQSQPAPRLLRTRLAGDAVLRAFLSNRYRTIDNVDLAQVVLPILMEPGWRIASAAVTDTRLYIQAVSERVTTEVVRGDVVQAGVVVSNSEVGAGALQVEPMVYRLVCTNGMIAGTSLRRNHVGRAFGGDDSAEEFFSDETRRLDDRALVAKIRDTVRAAVDRARFERLVDKMRLATTVAIGDVQTAVEVTTRHLDLTDDEGASVLNHLAAGGDLSLYGLMNAVTRTAQDAPSYDRAIELERLGGDLLTSPPAFSAN